MKDVTEFLKEKPEVAEVKANVESMKEECVQKMVELGKLREALDESGRSTVDSQINMKMNSLYKAPWYATYNDVQQHYFQDRDFHKVIISFNIITQYASFDLLKKQEPEEAQRLGIQ
jgi:regulator of replication initiation timing